MDGQQARRERFGMGQSATRREPPAATRVFALPTDGIAARSTTAGAVLGMQQIDGGGRLEGSPVRREKDARVTVMGTDQPVQLGDGRLSGRAVGGRGGGQMPEPVRPPVAAESSGTSPRLRTSLGRHP